MKTRHLLKGLKVLYLAFHFVLMVFPLYWIVITSLKPQKDIFSMPIRYWPETISFENYANIFKVSKFHVYIGNSLLIAILAAIIVIAIAILGGYVMARFKFRGHKQIMIAFFVTQMLPGFVALALVFVYVKA